MTKRCESHVIYDTKETKEVEIAVKGEVKVAKGIQG